MIKQSSYSFSLLFLVLANAIPILGVLFWGWEVSHILFLYWIESAIIGFYSLIKMAIVAKWQSLFLIPFFLVHYSGFMVAHLLLLIQFFFPGIEFNGDWRFIQVELFYMALVLKPAILALIVSHGMSFIVNFLYKKEYKQLSGKAQSFMPYNRIVIMHITIIFAGALTIALGETFTTLLLFIFVKMVVDITSHLKVHKTIEEQKQTV